MKTIYSLLLLILISCNKDYNKPEIVITPTLTTEDGKWVINLNYSPEINTNGIVRFYWVVKDNSGKSYKWFGAIPIDNPTTNQKYNSQITSFTPYTLDSLILEPDDYLNKYTILIKQ